MRLLPHRRNPSRGPVTVRRVQILLALLWILDGALQLQPFMFTRGFADQVIAPAGQGQPAFVAVPVAWAAHLIAAHPVLFDSLFAAAQLGLGAGILWRRTVRAALGASVLWALGVWYMGEGLGGLGGGQTSLLTGAPGAVLIYAVLAVAVFPAQSRPAREADRRSPSADSSWDSTLPGWTPWAWAAIWIGGAGLSLVPGNKGLAATIAASSEGAPIWLSTLDRHVTSLVRQTGGSADIALFSLELLIGLLPLLGRFGRITGCGAGLALLAMMWLVGQSLGQIYSGQATDPNTAVPLAVLGLGVLMSGRVVQSGPRESNLPGGTASDGRSTTDKLAA